VVDFLIVAWAVFLLVKAVNSLRRKEDSEAKKV
jgi:large-conductance mechanosensitive channel